MKYNHIVILFASILISIISLSVSYSYASFSDTLSIPPNNNTAAPINTSGENQVKNGAFQSNSELLAPVFRSSQDSRYYIHPIGASRLNQIYSDYIYNYGAIDAPDVYLRNAGRWASQVNGSPNRFWISGSYGFAYNHPSVSNLVSLVPTSQYQFCSVSRVLHDGSNGGWCSVYPNGGVWQMSYGKWGSGGIECQASCIGW